MGSCNKTIVPFFSRWLYSTLLLEIVFIIAAPAFDILVIGCVLNIKIVYTTAEKLTFEAFYWPSNAARCY